jgi:periplasmic protein TonB
MAAVRIAVNEESLKGPLVWSLFGHFMLVALLMISTLLSHRGEGWGGAGGGAVSVKLVGALGGVPLPKPEAVTTSRVVDTSKGLYKTEPPPKPVKPPPDAKEIPEFKKEKRPRYVSRPSRTLEDDTPPPENAVPYGGGGAPSVPYAQNQFSLGGGGTSGGMGFSGGAGGGDFGSRFPYYVEAVQRRVSGNWIQSTVDASVRWAPRAVVTFDILRSGAIANVQILRSSSNTSVDNSAVRAILGSSPVQPLPGEYSGSKVSVEFWFDFRR